MKPLLKWAGGKRSIAPLIQQHLPPGWEDGAFFEPFFGGGAVFLHLLPKRAQISDINRRLIDFYLDVKNRPDDLFGEIALLAASFNEADAQTKKENYLSLRAEFNRESRPIRNSALFFALNKLCFNGLYRENSRGDFNVPFGQKTEFPKVVIDDFYEVSGALANAEIFQRDFQEAASQARPGDFVYLDPPYIPLTPTASFTSYSSSGFGIDAQQRLAQTMRRLGSEGVRVMMSNSMTATTLEVFADFRHEVISAPRNVGANSNSRGSVLELLVMNY